jgi:hypothetical protein
MIDFNNAKYMKLREVSEKDGQKLIGALLIPDEEIIGSFKTVRDMVIFTNRRIIAVNIQGFSGKKKDFTSLPYSKVQAFSFESAGTFDLDAELELWFSGLGKVRFEFNSRFDVTKFSKSIGSYIL